MASIRIYGDTNKGCIFFDGSRVEPKFLGTIFASVKPDETDRLVIQRTDVFRRDGVTFRTLFRRLKATRVQNEAGENLISDLGFSVADVAVYINQQASNYSAGTAVRPELDEHPNFVLDATQTSIMVDNGEVFGVNTIKAILGPDGLVDIVSSDHSGNAVTYYEDCPHENLQINGSFIGGGPNDVVDALNELFTVGPFEAVVIRDPYATLVADVDGEFAGHSLVGTTAQDPAGNDIFTNLSSGNYAGLKSTATIDQTGEYFTFDIRGEGQIGFGLIHSDASFADGKYIGNVNYADPDTFAVGNSAHYGFQFSHWFHPTPNGSWTNYGASTAFSIRPGWSNWDQKQDWLDGNPVKIKVGIDNNGFISIESLQDDGSWVVHARTSYPVPEGSEFHLGIKAANSAPRVYSAPKVHLREPEAPVMYFRYIESGDGNFHYPLFATAEEANYYHKVIAGVETGQSHTHVYPDDPTQTIWHMPENGQMAGTAAPYNMVFDGQTVLFTEITSLTDADLTPSAYPDTTISVDEGSSINIQTQPMDTAYVTTFSGLPVGVMELFAGMLGGTAPEVTGDNVANPFDDYAITVTRTNSYGSTTGTLTLRVNNLTAPVVTPIAGFTHEAASTSLVDSDTMDDGSVVAIDNILDDGNRLVINRAFVDNQILPEITAGSGDKSVWIGFARESGALPSWSSVSAADFEVAFEFFCDDAARAANNWRLRVHVQGTQMHNIGIGSTISGLYNYLFVNDGGEVKVGGLLPSYGDATSFVWDASAVSWDQVVGSLATQNRSIYIATDGCQMDLTTSEFQEVVEPNPAPAILTPWNKALDFSGSNEYAVTVNAAQSNNPTRIAPAVTIASPAAGQTVSNGRPWATSIVFSSDNHNSNQHIWNQGEGSGSTDDNIYLRTDADGHLYFGWGREGSLNECLIHPSGSNSNWELTAGNWYGIYIAHNGARFNSSDATPANLASAFDIRLMGSSNSWATSGYSDTNLSTSANWINSGGNMSRSVDGYFSIGGRRNNRSFHGKVASMVRTTLLNGVAMPDSAEIEMMITDPLAWKNTYKQGSNFRQPQSDSGTSVWTNANATTRGRATQIWLMGDGGNDSYSNMIRNRINPNDQNDNKLNLISMVSNDIQNVTINGLS